MSEQTLTTRERSSGPGGLGSLFDESEPLPRHVTVSSGPYAENLPLAGRTVGEVRRLIGPRFDIAPNSQAVVNGHDVSDDTVLQQGQALAFMHRAGEKGATPGQGTQAYKRGRPRALTRWDFGLSDVAYGPLQSKTVQYLGNLGKV